MKTKPPPRRVRFNPLALAANADPSPITSATKDVSHPSPATEPDRPPEESARGRRAGKRRAKNRRGRQSANPSESLQRAISGPSLANYPLIFEGFAAKGIPEADIKPRENVFTFHAWRALGRAVRKGEHGVKICSWIPCGDAGDEPSDGGSPGEDGADASTQGETKRSRGRPVNCTVFHISQTEEIAARDKSASTPSTEPSDDSPRRSLGEAGPPTNIIPITPIPSHPAPPARTEPEDDDRPSWMIALTDSLTGTDN